jgi:hypoxanthine phosphoribosyltransferase
MSLNSKIYLTWENVEDLILILVEKLKSENYNSIFGIPRGGLIPAVLLSHKLNIPITETINENTLVVDDISDTGITLNGKYKNTATLHYRTTSIYKPTHFASELFSDDWIVYPWEEKNSKSIQDYKL